MFPLSPRFLLAPALACAALVSLSAASKPPVNASRESVALKGYDVVAYFRGTPTAGRAQFEHRWNGATFRFSNGTNRDAFAAGPEKFAPQFGGYCSYAVSRGYTADIDPEAYRIVDGKLYLNYSKRVQKLWEEDISGNIAKAEANWPGVLDK